MNEAGAEFPFDVTAIVVSYNSEADLPGMIESLRAASQGLRLRTVIVDNGSQDGSVAAARAMGVECLATGRNAGYAAAINAGRAVTTDSRCVLVVNPDVRFLPAAVTTLFREASRHQAVAVPRLIDEQGHTEHSLRRDPTIVRQFGEALLGDHAASRPAYASVMVREPTAYSRAAHWDWATGAVVMVPAACDAAVGDWDERYFLYSEEVDYCHRARRAGFPVRFVPDAVVMHEGGGSGAGPALAALDAVNKVRLYRRWHGRTRAAVYAVGILLEAGLRLGRPGHAQILRLALPEVVRAAVGRHDMDGHAVYGRLLARSSAEGWADHG